MKLIKHLLFRLYEVLQLLHLKTLELLMMQMICFLKLISIVSLKLLKFLLKHCSLLSSLIGLLNAFERWLCPIRLNKRWWPLSESRKNSL